MQNKITLKNKANSAPLLPLCVMILGVATSLLSDSTFGFDNNLYLSLIILQMLVLALPAAIYIKLSGISVKDCKLTFFSPTKIYFVILTTLTIVFGSTVFRLMMAYIGQIESLFGEYYDPIVRSSENAAEIIFLLLTFALIPALCQEIVYSGISLGQYDGYNLFSQALLCGILSAFFRFDAGTFLMFVFNGALCAFAVQVTKSVFSAVIIHFTFNAFNLFLEKYILRIITQSEYATLCAFVLISGFLLCCFLTFAECERMYHNEAIDQYKLKVKMRKNRQMLAQAQNSPLLEGKEAPDENGHTDEDDEFNSANDSLFGKWLKKLTKKLAQIFTPFASVTLLAALGVYILGCLLKR